MTTYGISRLTQSVVWTMLVLSCALHCGCASLPSIDPSGERIFLPGPTSFADPIYAPSNEPGALGGGFFRGGLFGGGWFDLDPDYEEPCPLPSYDECNEPEDLYGWEPHPLLNHPNLLADRVWGREAPVGNPLTRAPGGPPVAPPQPLGPPYGVVVPQPIDAEINTGGRPFHTHHAALQLTPQRLVAPVGQAVLLRAGICGIDGFMITGQPVEWSLSTDSVGSIVEVDQADKRLWRTFWHRPPKKLSGQYAVGLTSTINQLLPRGTIGVNDDVWLLRGQTWASVTSASEGATHVTAVAPSVAGWNERRKSATIHWVDGQWGFPPPSISSSSAGQTLVTRVTRATSNAPIEGWIVRYEIAGGTPAALDTAGAQTLEVRTNNNGEAPVTIMPQGEFAGVTNVNIQVIRTGNTPGDLARLPVGQGSTSVTWVAGQVPDTPLPPGTGQPPAGPPAPAPTVTIRMSGPSTAEVESLATYQIRVDNLGLQPINSVEVTSAVPPEFEFVSSVPEPQSAGGELRWQMGPLQPGQPRQITLNYRVRNSGSIRVCAAANVGAVLPAEDCVTTIVASGPGIPGPPPGNLEPANLNLAINGPATATVGARVQYQLFLTNPTNRTVGISQIVIDFADGLEHAIGPSPIRNREAGSLAPGERRFIPVEFAVRTAGQHCFDVEVIDDGGGRSTGRYCVTAGVSQPGPQPPQPGTANIVVQQTGPSVAYVGDQFSFQINVTNLSSAEVTNVRVVAELDPAFEPRNASPGLRRGVGNSLIWTIPSIQARQYATLQIEGTCLERSPQACSRVTASAGAMVANDETCVRIEDRAAPLGDPQPDLRGPERPDTFAPINPAPTETPPTLTPPGSNDAFDLRSSLDIKVRAGVASSGNVREYFIEVVNSTSTDQSDVVVTALLPQGTSFVKSLGQPGISRSSVDGRELEFNPIRTLRARERVSIQLMLNTRGRTTEPPLVRAVAGQ